MKKFSLYTFLAAFCTVLFVSCEKAAEDNAAGYSTFYLSMPTFTSAGGEKTHWDSQGLWWDESGDVVRINGDQHRIVYSDGAWRTTGGTSTNPVNGDQYYICYMGKGNQGDAGWDPSTLKYTNVDLTSIVPLVGYGKTNFITLQPCCAVLKITNLSAPITSIKFGSTPGNIFPKKGTLDPVEAIVKDVPNIAENYFQSSEFNANASEAIFVLPMMRSSETFDKITFTYSDPANDRSRNKVTRNNPITIEKGHVYLINWSTI